MNKEKFPYMSLVIVIASLIYIFSPLDIIPDAFLGLGQIDDIAIFAIMFRQFKNILAYNKRQKNKKPPEVVAEVQSKPSEQENPEDEK